MSKKKNPQIKTTISDNTREEFKKVYTRYGIKESEALKILIIQCIEKNKLFIDD